MDKDLYGFKDMDKDLYGFKDMDEIWIKFSICVDEVSVDLKSFSYIRTVWYRYGIRLVEVA